MGQGEKLIKVAQEARMLKKSLPAIWKVDFKVLSFKG